MCTLHNLHPRGPFLGSPFPVTLGSAEDCDFVLEGLPPSSLQSEEHSGCSLLLWLEVSETKVGFKAGWGQMQQLLMPSSSHGSSPAAAAGVAMQQVL